MIAAWMVAATIVALLFALGAAAAQRVFALYRGVPVRWFWAAAIGGTLIASALWLAPHRSAPATSTATVGVVAPAGVAPARDFRLPSTSAATERGLLVVWAAASGALALMLAFALARLAWEGRRWQNGEVDGTPVNISNSMGPAAVGMLRPRVVIPRWVLSLDGAAQRAIVLHEQEHRRTRDPALLVAGLAALVLMPWNVGMWLAWRGLRLAVEFDCDERVLRRGIDRVGYAQILLGAWGQTRASWLPSAALTRASGLGSRVQHLMRPEPRRRGMKALIGTMAAALLVFAACESPGPQSIAGPAPSMEVVRDVPGQSVLPMVILDGVAQDQGSHQTRVMGDVALTLKASQDSHDAEAQGRLMKVVPDSDQAASERKVTLDAVSFNARTSGPSKVQEDGVAGVLSRIPPDSIASIEVLKGNKATAQYGPGAVHGVIIITTKAAARDTTKM